MKIKALIIFGAIMSSTSALFAKTADDQSFSRGIMLAVDTRDHAACESTKTYLKILEPTYKEDICKSDSYNPLSVIVVTTAVDEWEFMAEIDMSRKAPRNIMSHPAGFVSNTDGGVLFLLPDARDSDNKLRVALKKERSVAHLRLSDLSLLEDYHMPNIAISFIFKKLPASLSPQQKAMAERMVRRIRIRHTSEKPGGEESTALSSLNILEGLNNSIKDITNKSFEVDLFMPKDLCPTNGTCPTNKSDTILPLKLGFSFKMKF
ncbi:hypothetical protein [Bdellovibrio sp. NC01]|uniref:hypothetical protein n=1 Tax=Bdellovibrio sp. NC01 TaxID=2220073 RepID=UPI00115A8C24|nr:hypothetical protein [Bdellovibrio sp. NC01]QDK37244.1 hypothetical protein DOE51_06385 [Bdellovibrio sp. NC01]